jgi:transcription antitermination factor NusG
MPWYVLITKPRFEKKVTARLLKMGVKAFCPTRVENRQWSDRIKKVEVPLLPSMVLVFLENKERQIVFQVPGSLRYFFWLGKPAKVSALEIDALNNIQKDNSTVVEVEKLTVGSEIEIDTFDNVAKKGIVKKVSGNYCWVTLHNLGCIVKIKI